MWENTNIDDPAALRHLWRDDKHLDHHNQLRHFCINEHVNKLEFAFLNCGLVYLEKRSEVMNNIEGNYIDLHALHGLSHCLGSSKYSLYTLVIL